MDDLDARIIKELAGPGSYQWDVRQSYSTIAHKLQVDEETVRRRIRRAEKSGFLTGAELILNPYLIGREPVAMELKAASSEYAKKLSMISQVKLVDGVILIINLQGEGLQVLLYSESEQAISRRTELIASICGCKEPLILRKIGFPRCDLTLTRTDLLMLKSLRREPRKSSSNVAMEIGISTRTVDRRLAIFIEKNAFFHVLRPDFRRSEGVTYRLIISYGDAKRKPALDEIISSRLERIVFYVTAGNMVSLFIFICPNVIEAEGIQEWVQKLDGVAGARMGIIKDFIVVSGWLDDEIERMLSQKKLS